MADAENEEMLGWNTKLEFGTSINTAILSHGVNRSKWSMGAKYKNQSWNSAFDLFSRHWNEVMETLISLKE